MKVHGHLKCRLEDRRTVTICSVACVWIAVLAGLLSHGAAEVQDEESRKHFRHVLTLPGARQTGVGCAFYANVPALTLVSGIHVVDETRDSRAFVTGVYGLRRGDFLMRRAFDKEIFFELFGIGSKEVTLYYEDLDRRTLLNQAEGLVTGDLKAALDRGQFASLRVYGELGMPHNVLLLAHGNGFYHFHDPTTGTIRRATAAGLAARMLTESKKGHGKLRKRYFSRYHLVTLGEAKPAGKMPLRLDQLPGSLELKLDERQRARIAELLTPTVEGLELTATPEARMKAFPGIDLAVMTKADGKAVKLVSVIDPVLDGRDLRGLAHIAKLSLNSYQIGARELLPVWFVDGRPQVVAGYSQPEGEKESTVTLFDGSKSRVVPLTEALTAARASGSLVGHVEVSR